MKAIVALGTILLLTACGVKRPPLPPIVITPQEMEAEDTLKNDPSNPRSKAKPSPKPKRKPKAEPKTDE